MANRQLTPEGLVALFLGFVRQILGSQNLGLRS